MFKRLFTGIRRVVRVLLGPFFRLSLLTQFMLLSGLILLLGAAFIGWWINRAIEQQVIANSLHVTAVFVDSTIAPHLWELSDLEDITPAQEAHLDQLLRSNIQRGDFVAFHITKPNGEHVYSTPPISPSTNMNNTGADVAAQGQIYSQFTDHIDFLPPEQQQQPRNLIETYFPVRDKSGNQVIAVASFYQSLDTMRQAMLVTQLQGWVIVGIATFLMYVLLFSLVKRGSDTIERQTLALAESRQQIQRAAVRAAEVNEDAMRRLGADLHDGPAQDLGIALMRMEPLRDTLSRQQEASDGEQPDPEVVAFDLNLIHTALQSSLQEIRNMAAGLRLPELGDLDLAGAIRKAVTDYSRKTGREVTVSGPAELEGNNALKSAAYRIVQESLNNGHLHGKPTAQWVDYASAGDVLTLTIRDNGIGFDPTRQAEHGRRRQLGLAGLQERAEILGGHLHIQSAPGQGATIQAVLPLDTIDTIDNNLDTFTEGG
jgi:signal transduction histidine kinase